MTIVKTELDEKATTALEQCKVIAPSSAREIENAAGVLVFPRVLKVDLFVGGSGGRGVLFVKGEVQGYYDIGEVSAGLQIGIDEMSIVYVFRDAESLANLTQGNVWEVGATAGIVVITADADAASRSGSPIVYVFDAGGLSAELDVSVLRIWKSR